MSELRAVRPEEIDLVAQLYNNAYRVGLATARGWVQGLPTDETVAILEPGRVASIVRMIPYTVWVGGAPLAMGGIGGVATWADCQGKGYAGTLMRESVKRMRERGCRLSSLYPFSHRYYRKFGWETAGRRTVLTEFTPADVHRYEEKDLVRACLSEADLDPIDTVYREYASSLNGMVVRDRQNWKRRFNALPDLRGQAYLIEDDGRPVGYFFCENHPLRPGAYESRTSQFACITPRARRAFFGFLSTLPTNVKSITLMGPPFPWLLDHFKEPFFPSRCEPTFQVRVVDVKPALIERGFDPDLRGRLTLELHDECADWNTGTWALAFEGGRCLVTEGVSDPPDFRLTIQEFSRLYIGAVDPVAQARQGAFPAATPAALRLLRDAFHDRLPYLADEF